MKSFGKVEKPLDQVKKTTTMKTLLASALMICAPLSALALPVTWDKQKPIPFGASEASSPLKADQGRVVFYRLPDNLSEQTSVNLGIDGRLETSLRAGNYTQHPICVGAHKLSSVVTGEKSNDLEELPKYVDIDNENEFFRVTVMDGGSVLTEQVPTDVALEQLDGLQLQWHAVNRTSQIKCEPPANAAPLAPAPALDSTPVAPMSVFPIEAVFFFDFDIDELDSTELARADQLVAELGSLNQDYTIYLSGYADPMGTNSYNNALSARRAQAVGLALVNRGVDEQDLRMSSFGETPEFAQCSTMPSDAAVKQCNRENRRVNVLIKEAN